MFSSQEDNNLDSQTQQSFGGQEFRMDSMNQTQQVIKPKLKFQSSQNPAFELVKSTHFSKSPPDYLLSSLDQSNNSKREDDIRLSDEDPNFNSFQMKNFKSEMTADSNFTTRMKNKAEPASFTDEFISV